tara:strand:+ start:231 stop:569 length:339 start_codon:yes stop_codon:yes gene_type:complete
MSYTKLYETLAREISPAHALTVCQMQAIVISQDIDDLALFSEEGQQTFRTALDKALHTILRDHPEDFQAECENLLEQTYDWELSTELKLSPDSPDHKFTLQDKPEHRTKNRL